MIYDKRLKNLELLGDNQPLQEIEKEDGAVLVGDCGFVKSIEYIQNKGYMPLEASEFITATRIVNGAKGKYIRNTDFTIVPNSTIYVLSGKNNISAHILYREIDPIFNHPLRAYRELNDKGYMPIRDMDFLDKILKDKNVVHLDYNRFQMTPDNLLPTDLVYTTIDPENVPKMDTYKGMLARQYFGDGNILRANMRWASKDGQKIKIIFSSRDEVMRILDRDKMLLAFAKPCHIISSERNSEINASSRCLSHHNARIYGIPKELLEEKISNNGHGTDNIEGQ